MLQAHWKTNKHLFIIYFLRKLFLKIISCGNLMPNSDNADARDGNEFDNYDKTEFPNSIMPGFVDQELSL